MVSEAAAWADFIWSLWWRPLAPSSLARALLPIKYACVAYRVATEDMMKQQRHVARQQHNKVGCGRCRKKIEGGQALERDVAPPDMLKWTLLSASDVG